MSTGWTVVCDDLLKWIEWMHVQYIIRKGKFGSERQQLYIYRSKYTKHIL